MQRLSRLTGVLACLSVLLFVSGCEDVVTQENFDRITVGMQLWEVEDILGAGTEETVGGFGISSGGLIGGEPGSSATTTYVWKEERREISVTVKDGEVIGKRKAGL